MLNLILWVAIGLLVAILALPVVRATVIWATRAHPLPTRAPLA